MDSTHGALQTEGELARQRQRIHAHASRSSAVTVRGPGQDQRGPRSATTTSETCSAVTCRAVAHRCGERREDRESPFLREEKAVDVDDQWQMHRVNQVTTQMILLDRIEASSSSSSPEAPSQPRIPC